MKDSSGNEEVKEDLLNMDEGFSSQQFSIYIKSYLLKIQMSPCIALKGSL